MRPMNQVYRLGLGAVGHGTIQTPTLTTCGARFGNIATKACIATTPTAAFALSYRGEN